MRRMLSAILLLIIAFTVNAQWKCAFTHYSSEEGLSQQAVMSILEDSKGYLWFATWDGINKFDGYSFRTYKESAGNGVGLTNNRVDYIAEDAYGQIWVRAYDNRVFRFDPSTENFTQVPAEGKESNLSFTDVRILNDRHVWLLTENEGAVRVTIEAGGQRLRTDAYSMQSGLFPSMRILNVSQDQAGNEWLLTNNGLGMILRDSIRPSVYFSDTPSSKGRNKQAFFAMYEGEDTLYFGSEAGRIWMYRIADQSFQLLELPTASDVISIHSGADDGLIVATRRDGFFTWQPASGQSVHYTKTSNPRLPGNEILNVYVDREQEVWFNLADAKGVTHFNPYTKTIRQETPSTEEGGAYRAQPAFFIHEDVNGYLWVHPFDGGFSLYDRKEGRLKPFYNQPGAADWRFSNKVHSAMSDRQGNLWMSTHSKGLEKITFLPDRFQLRAPVPLTYESLSNHVRSLLEDNKGRLWMGLRDGMIRVYDKNVYLGYLAADGSISKTARPFDGVAYNIIQDSCGRIWIATKGNGLIRAEEVNGHFRLTTYLSDPNNLYSLSDNNVYSLHEDRSGRLWIATFGGGLNYLDEQADGSVRFINHQNNLKGYPIDACYRVRFVTSDTQGNIWVGTTSGVVVFAMDFTSPEAIRFRHYLHMPNDPASLSNNDVYWVTETSDKEIFLATFGGGLNKLQSVKGDDNASFTAYTIAQGLPSDVLLSMQEDAQKNLWISTENRLFRFDPATGQADSYNDKSLNIQAGFSEGASIRLSDGRLLFGTSNGLLSFSPGEMSKSSFVPPVIFTRLLVNNDEVRPGQNHALGHILDDTERLTLSHRQNTVTLQYAAIDMNAPEDIRYAYILEGFDKEWSYVDKQRVVTYTNLPKGEYVFRVKSTNHDGVWVDNARGLPVTILPSFWETPWALLLYILAILGIIFAGVYILFTIYRLKHEVTVEQQISDIKLRFFTNISHEFRTPLTLISGPVEHVLKYSPLTPEAREQLQLVERNTDRMLRLVDQILDFRKIQNRKMKLKVQRIELVSFTRRIMDSFESLADEHEIDYIFEPEQRTLFIWADADQLEKIIFNLLSNAFKYTPVGKMIKVFIRNDEKTVSFGVQDQGIGIAPNKKDTIFVRFEQLVDKNLFNQSSSGIGLSLVKELVEMHRATIQVDSELGTGSTFTVVFTKGKDHYPPQTEFLLTDYALPTITDAAVPPAQSPAPVPETSGEAMEETSADLMLLVEDNDELRTFLRAIFAASFRIIEAKNGVEGVEKALSFVPDIIISDVMMPDKDGIELTRELRANLSTSHIPIILLTAKSALESKLEGMEYGANDYITKPFSSTYLKARVENLLMQHRKMQELYRSNLMSTTSEKQQQPELTTDMSPNDRKFIDRLVELMDTHMDNGDLVVEDLVAELAVSRSVFFKKLKALTGLAPIEFIREIRVKRAAELIETGEYNMSQISYMVGINDPRYFSKCFKQKYGMTPTEYKEQKIHPNSQNIHTGEAE